MRTKHSADTTLRVSFKHALNTVQLMHNERVGGPHVARLTASHINKKHCADEEGKAEEEEEEAEERGEGEGRHSQGIVRIWLDSRCTILEIHIKCNQTCCIGLPYNNVRKMAVRRSRKRGSSAVGMLHNQADRNVTDVMPERLKRGMIARRSHWYQTSTSQM